MRCEEHAALNLPDDLPVIGPLHRDGKRGPLQSWLVTPIGHDCVHLAGTKGEGVLVCTRGLNFEFVSEFAFGWIHLPFAYEGIVCRPYCACHQAGSQQQLKSTI